MIGLTINGIPVEVPEGSTVLQAAEALGIVIPTLCHHKDLTPFGGCRLCVVEVKGARLPATACNLPVSNGLVVQTDTPRLIEYRRAVLKMLLASFYDAGYKHIEGRFELDLDSQFAYWVDAYGIDMRSFMASRPRHPIDSDPNPFVWVDMNKCIQCTRCVRACAEIQGRFVWAQAFRGNHSRIVAGADSTMLASRCESCGACVAYCPTGALDNKMSVSLGRADRLVRTTCPYCSVGCQFDLQVKNDPYGSRVIRVTSTPEAPVNGLHLCLKGRYGYEFIHHPERLKQPRVREYLLKREPRPANLGPWVETDWDTALDLAAEGLWSRREAYGAEGVGVIPSGKLLNEESYLMGKLARQVLQTNNIDCAEGIHSGSPVDGLDEAIGWSAMTGSFADIARNARSALVIGSQTTEQHPVFGVMIRQAALRRRLHLVVIDPEFPNMAEYAAVHLVNRPGTEVALLNGLMHVILKHGWQSDRFIEKDPEGFAAFRNVIDQYTPERVTEITGIPAQKLVQAAEILANNRPAAVIWSAGVGRYGPPRPVVFSLANLQLLLGGLDQPGGGLNPLPAHSSQLGAYDMGCRPDSLPGYQPVTSDPIRRQFEEVWGASLPAWPGLTAAEMLSTAQRGRLKALYIAGEDLTAGAASDPARSSRLLHSLEACEFIVLQEILASETDRLADIILPGASFAEKTGTFTSAERRIQLVREAVQPPGLARPDWIIIASLARRILALGERSGAAAPYAGWEYADTNQIMTEIATLTPIYACVSHERLLAGDTLQWPVYDAETPGAPLLPLRPCRFTPVEYHSLAAEPI